MSYLEMLELQNFVSNLVQKLKNFELTELKKYYDVDKTISKKSFTETNNNKTVNFPNEKNQNTNGISENEIKYYPQLLEESMKKELKETKNSENYDEDDNDSTDEESELLKKDNIDSDKIIQINKSTKSLESEDIFEPSENNKNLLNSDNVACGTSEENLESKENIELTSANPEGLVIEETTSAKGEFSKPAVSNYEKSKTKPVSEDLVTSTTTPSRMRTNIIFLDMNEMIMKTTSASETGNTKLDEEDSYRILRTRLDPVPVEKNIIETTTLENSSNRDVMPDGDILSNYISEITTLPPESPINEIFLVLNPIDDTAVGSQSKNQAKTESDEIIFNKKSHKSSPINSLKHSYNNITSNTKQNDSYDLDWTTDEPNQLTSDGYYEFFLSEQDKNIISTTASSYVQTSNPNIANLPLNNNKLTEKIDKLIKNNKNINNKTNMTQHHKNSTKESVEFQNSTTMGESLNKSSQETVPTVEKENQYIVYIDDSTYRDSQEEVENQHTDIIAGVEEDQLKDELYSTKQTLLPERMEIINSKNSANAGVAEVQLKDKLYSTNQTQQTLLPERIGIVYSENSAYAVDEDQLKDKVNSTKQTRQTLLPEKIGIVYSENSENTGFDEDQLKDKLNPTKQTLLPGRIAIIYSENSAKSKQIPEPSELMENQKIENYTNNYNNDDNKMQNFAVSKILNIKNNYDDNKNNQSDNRNNDKYTDFETTQINEENIIKFSKINVNNDPRHLNFQEDQLSQSNFQDQLVTNSRLSLNRNNIVATEKNSGKNKEEKEYFDTFLEYLYNHSNSSFFQALKKN